MSSSLPTGRILAMDYGRARIGLALSDERRIIASPLPFLLTRKNLEDTAVYIAEELAKHLPLSTIVMGLPLHLSGKESPMSEEVRTFASRLETLSKIPIVLWDERLSTAQVEKELKNALLSRKKRAPLIDSLTATLLLQTYLDRNV